MITDGLVTYDPASMTGGSNTYMSNSVFEFQYVYVNCYMKLYITLYCVTVIDIINYTQTFMKIHDTHLLYIHMYVP